MQVFVLGRMGNAQQALGLLMRDLKDVQGAVEFVALQGGSDLWQLLLSLALADPDVTGAAPGADHVLGADLVAQDVAVERMQGLSVGEPAASK